MVKPLQIRELETLMTGLTLAMGSVEASRFIAEQAVVASEDEADLALDLPQDFEDFAESATETGADFTGPLLFILLIKYGFNEMLGGGK